MQEIIRRNVEIVQKRIAQAAQRVGRAAEEITLVAVTKTVTSPVMRVLLEEGICHWGENRVQDALQKVRELGFPSGVTWHLIGHLQRNKVKEALSLFHLLHSVDSLRLAQEIEEQAARRNSCMRILLQVNTSGEQSKFGWLPAQFEADLAKIVACPHVAIQGLMTMAPQSEDPESGRPYFRALATLSREILAPQIPALSQSGILSMGMSQDFEVAVEEGATMVRIGSALFTGLSRLND